MLQTFKNGQTSVVLRVKLLDSSSTTGAGLTGLTSASSGLIISTIADNEASATAYTVAGSTIEAVTTLGTYAAPTSTKCRFKEVDATNHKGVYEFQFADARFAVSSAKSLLVSVQGATNLQQADFVVQLQTLDPYLANLTAAQIATGVWTDTTAGDFTTALSVGKSVMNGVTLGTGLTVNAVTGLTASNLDTTISSRMATFTPLTAAQIATGVWQDATAGDFTTANSIGKSLYNAFTANSSVYTVAALANAPSGTGASASAIATAIWQDTTAGDFTVSASIGKSIMNGVALGTGLTVNDITTKTGYSLSSSQTFNLTGSITGSLSGSVGSVTGAVGSVTGSVDSVTGAVGSVTGLTASDVGAIKTKTDSLGFTVAGYADVNIRYVNSVHVNGDGSVSTPWGP